MSAPEQEFFSRMAYAVPLSAAGALAHARFEEGDVFYNDLQAHTDWKAWRQGGAGKAPIAIQVRLPRRDSPGAVVDDAGSGDSGRKRSFGINWEAQVELEYLELGGSSKLFKTTQGRLFHCLWTGDAGYLDPDGASPPMPRLRAALVNDLAGKVKAGKKDDGKGKSEPTKKEKARIEEIKKKRERMLGSPILRGFLRDRGLEGSELVPSALDRRLLVSVIDHCNDMQRPALHWYLDQLGGIAGDSTSLLAPSKSPGGAKAVNSADDLDLTDSHPGMEFHLSWLPEGAFERIGDWRKGFVDRFPEKTFSRFLSSIALVYSQGHGGLTTYSNALPKRTSKASSKGQPSQPLLENAAASAD